MEVITIFISWLGNSSFLIKTSLGKRILIDPINKFHSCNLTNLSPNIITLSSENFRFNCFSLSNKNIYIISNPGKYEKDNLSIECFSSYSDNLQGLKRGNNLIFLYKIDDLTLCHLGYLGHVPSPSILSKIKECDILFLPIGGNITLDGKVAYKLAKLINPKIIIPMNYKLTPYSFLFKGPEHYLLLTKNSKKIKEESFLINSSTLPSSSLNTILLSPLSNSNII